MTLKHLSVLLLITTMLLPACSAPPASPQVVGPALTLSMAADTLKVGETVEISVLVQSVPYLAGVDIKLAYDTTALTIVDANAETDGTQATITDLVKPDFVAINTAGEGAIHLVYASTTAATQPDGTLFSFTVEGLSKGNTTLRFDGVKLANPDGQPLDVQTVDLALRVK